MNKKFFTFDQLHSTVNDNSEYSPHLHYNSYSSSFDTTISPQYSSPYHDTDSVSDKSKKIRKKRNTYQKIADETRKKLLDAVQQGDTLKAAAKRYGINYSSAKSILHTFRKEGRICKKSAQERTSRRRTKSTQELEMSPIYLYKQCADDFNNGVNEASTYQTYHSPEDKSPVASEDEGPKAGVSGLAINSFGGFLKVNSKNQVSKGEPMAAKAPGSTIVLKLGSQRMQNVVRNDNWQLNVNVQNGENQQVPYYKYNEDLQQNDSGRGQNAARQGNYGHYYMNYTESPLSQVAKKDQNQNPVRILGEVEEDYNNNAVPLEGQGYDVSCFLSASPAYAFQQRKAYGLEQYGNNNENFSGMENNLRGIIDPQELYYDGVNYRPRMEEGTEGLVKRAGLSGY